MFIIIIFAIIEYQLVMKEILNRIKSLRTAKNLKQADFAKLINMTQGGYSKIELGETELTIERLYKIADVLSVNIEYLLFGENEDKGSLKSKEVDLLKKEIEMLSYMNNLQKEKLENVSFKANEVFKEHILFIIAKELEYLIRLKDLPTQETQSIDNNNESLYFFISRVMDKKKPTIDEIYDYYSPYTIDDGYKNVKTREQEEEFIKKQMEKEKLKEKHKEQVRRIIYSMMEEYLKNNNKLDKDNYDKNLLVWLANYLFIGRDYSVKDAVEEEYFLRGFQKIYCYYCENNIITDEFLLGLYRLFLEWDKLDTEDYKNGKK